MVLLGVHHMKGSVTRGLLTKDVRSADGWQIGMDVFDQYVQVRCYRRIEIWIFSSLLFSSPRLDVVAYM